MSQFHFPPFKFRNGRDLIVRPVVIAVISVALRQKQPGGQWFVVSSINTAPKIKSHLPFASRESRRFRPLGYLLR